MIATDNTPPPTPPPPNYTSKIRFVVPGDVFAQVCVSSYQISDDLLALTRLVVTATEEGEIVETTRARFEQALRLVWTRVDNLQKILRIICDEGEMPEAQGATNG